MKNMKIGMLPCMKGLSSARHSLLIGGFPVAMFLLSVLSCAVAVTRETWRLGSNENRRFAFLDCFYLATIKLYRVDLTRKRGPYALLYYGGFPLRRRLRALDQFSAP